MPPRSSRHRGASQRWLVIPFLVTILALLVDASMHARSAQPQRTLDSQAWVDAVLPDIAASTAQGLDIADITSEKLSVKASTVASELSGIAAQAASTARSASAATPPPEVATAAGLLDACLLAREQGAQALANATDDLVHGHNQVSALAEMGSASTDFAIGDSAYNLFTQGMPKLGVTMPASQWDPATGSYQESTLNAFSQRLLAGVVTTPKQVVAIDAVTTEPRALDTVNGVEVLSPASSLSVTVVVASGGPAPQPGIEVSATLTPALGQQSQVVSATVDVPAGQAYAVTLSGLRARLSIPSTLAIAAGPASTPDQATTQLRLVVPGPGFTGVPTTTVPPTSSSVPPASSNTTTTTTSAQH